MLPPRALAYLLSGQIPLSDCVIVQDGGGVASPERRASRHAISLCVNEESSLRDDVRLVSPSHAGTRENQGGLCGDGREEVEDDGEREPQRQEVGVLRRWGMGMPAIEIVEVATGGLVTAGSLAIVARLMPDTGLSAGAALAAGLIGAFVRYFVGLFLSDTNLGDTDFIEEAD